MEFITYIAKSAGILTLFYLIYVFVLRKDTFFTANRTFLLVGIASALLLPFVTFTTITLVEAPVFLASEDFSELSPVQTTQIAPVKETIDIWQLIIVAYFIGLGSMIIRFLFQLASLFKVLRKHPATKVNGFRFVEIADTIAPFSFFSYIVFNPETHEKQELEMILQHEKVHAAQWHSIDVLLANCVRALQWINPISWSYKKSIEANLEFLADYQTASNVSSKTEYQLALLKASSPLPIPALTNNFYHSFIKKRIIMLNKSNSNKYNQLKLMLILPALALFLWSFNTETVIKYNTPATENNPEETHAATKTSKTWSFKAETTNSELDALENYFAENYPESLVKISDRKRDANANLINFSFQTKFDGNDRFYTRFDRSAEAVFQTVYTIEPREKGVLLVSETGKDGMQFKITKEQLEMFLTEDKMLDLDSKSVKEKGTITPKEPILGKNPLYIINGKEFRKTQLPNDKTVEVDGFVEVFNKKEGKERYGDKGKDGVMFFNGVATFTNLNEKNAVLAKTPSTSLAKEVRIKITKNTTKEALESHKKELKKLHNINFEYSNVKFNAKDEMTSITIKYDGHGNSGTYSVSSDDGEPINDFYFYMDSEKGSSGFGSTESELYKNQRKALLKERKAMMVTRKEALKNAAEIRKEALSYRTESLNKRQENMSEIRSELAETRKELMQSRSELRQDAAGMRENSKVLAKTNYGINTGLYATNSEKIIITKDTTDAQLAAMKASLSEKGIYFNYKRVKRNTNGEITGILAKFDNGKGSKISKSIKTDDDEAIETLIVEM